MAERFRASSTPVREALRQLEAEGLLDSWPHRGVIVSAPNVERIASLYVVRRLVEPYAVRRAALRLSRRDFRRAGEINDALARAQETGEIAEARLLNHEFHFILYKGCGLPTLVDEIERLWSAYPWAEVNVGERPSIIEEHRGILDAVIEDDGTTIETCVAAHIRGGYLTVVRQLSYPEDDPFDRDSPDPPSRAGQFTGSSDPAGSDPDRREPHATSTRSRSRRT